MLFCSEDGFSLLYSQPLGCSWMTHKKQPNPVLLNWSGASSLHPITSKIEFHRSILLVHSSNQIASDWLYSYRTVFFLRQFLLLIFSGSSFLHSLTNLLRFARSTENSPARSSEQTRITRRRKEGGSSSWKWRSKTKVQTNVWATYCVSHRSLLGWCT